LVLAKYFVFDNVLKKKNKFGFGWYLTVLLKWQESTSSNIFIREKVIFIA